MVVHGRVDGHGHGDRPAVGDLETDGGAIGGVIERQAVNRRGLLSVMTAADGTDPVRCCAIRRKVFESRVALTEEDAERRGIADPYVLSPVGLIPDEAG